jgi:hypothetical protein
MRVSILVVAFLSLAAAAFAGGPNANTEKSKAAACVKGKYFIGKPIYLDDTNNSLIVKNAKEKRMEFNLADTAKILQNGQEIKIKELNTKTKLTVIYTKKKGTFIALRIEQEVAKTE